MAAIVDDDSQMITIGTGKESVAINLKHGTNDQTQSHLLASILVEIGDLEIQIRRSKKSRENGRKTSVKSPSLNFQNTEKERTIAVGAKQWDYSAQYGPQMWSRMYPQIESKKFQSPIRIYTDQCEYEPELGQRPFQIDADENCCQILENTGRSFQVSGKGYSRITGGPVSDEYHFLQFHMHWGSNELEGSEHVIDGVRLPGELHIVTWNTTRYQTPQEAAASEQFDGLMVFGILLKIASADNPELNKLLNLFSKVTYEGDKVSLDFGVVSLRSLFPNDLQSYYTYDGSLTTPMCTESVRWIVFREKMGLSRRQFDQLRQLKCGCKSDNSNVPYMTENFRPVMPLNGRIVYRSFN